MTSDEEASAGGRQLLKLDRAAQHLRALDAEIGGYLDSGPYKLVLNVQPSDQRLVLMEWHVITEPDESIGVIIGDCLHNLRSALDHLACRLVEANGGAVTERTQFPILDVRPTDKGSKPLKAKVVGGVAPNVLTIIDRLQPYTRGDEAPSHPLSILRHLSNADKHRLLHVGAAYLMGSRCRLTFPDGKVWEAKPRAGVAQHETPIAAFRFDEPFDKSLYGQVEMEAEGSAFVALKESGPWGDKPVTLLLNDIGQFVENVVVAGLHPFLR